MRLNERIVLLTPYRDWSNESERLKENRKIMRQSKPPGRKNGLSSIEPELVRALGLNPHQAAVLELKGSPQGIGQGGRQPLV